MQARTSMGATAFSLFAGFIANPSCSEVVVVVAVGGALSVVGGIADCYWGLFCRT